MKRTLHEIDTKLEEGRLLFAALAHITTTTHTDKTPDEVLNELANVAEALFPIERSLKNEKSNV